MNNNQENDTALSPYRILDLTEGGCMIGGRMLADMRADVIKIEPPGGSRSRIGPYYKDIAHPEKSLFWFAYNANKRGITLDVTTADGKQIFRRLVETADALIESFEPGYMHQLGLGYDDLCKIKPDIIMTSVTPFGQNGPKAHYKGSDLTAWASGGFLYICGDPDRAPTWIGYPQAMLHGGAESASGTMIALWHRCMTGEGQYVDVSIQECVIACDFQTPETWDLNKREIIRSSHCLQMSGGGAQENQVWKTRDGYILFVASGGTEPFKSSLISLVQWMDEEGMAPDWLKAMDWGAGYSSATVSQALVDRVEAEFEKFIKNKTKIEMYEEGALKRRIVNGPMANAKDLAENEQLKARDFWVSVEHPELNDTITYPGAFSKLSAYPVKFSRRAPLIGEHNLEIYEKELGFSRKELIMLKQAQVI